MENKEGKSNKNSGEGLEDKFKKFVEGKKTFDSLFSEMGLIRKQALLEDDDTMLKKLDEVGGKMQDIELSRMEEAQKGKASAA